MFPAKNNKSSRSGLSYFFTQRIHGKDPSGNMPGLVKPESEWERTAAVLENILRWEDDGGQMLAAGNPIDRSTPDIVRGLASE